MELKDKIKFLREKHGLTLEQVGNAVGVGKSTVRKWETGDIANMRRDKIERLALALHTTPAYLMGWDEAPAPASSEDLSEEALQIAHAFDAATDREKEMVRLTLDPYMRSPLGRSDKVV